jgi:hypothetical protein
MKLLLPAYAVLILLFIKAEMNAQDLDPRVYVRIPVNTTFLVAGFSM